ncbi:MAG: hypothetical protein WKF66_19180 [Pedobacter sp.]
MRDIKKQWYLTGINGHLNTPEKVLEFLKEETVGYKIITVGSSAGGFNAIITGQFLNAEKIFSFNGQFEILSLLSKSSANVDPIVFRNQKNNRLLPYYDTLKFITNPKSIYYFHSNGSQWDIEQFDHAKNQGVHKISFKTSNHGVPFLKTNLSYVINMTSAQLKELSGNTYQPLIFSIKTVGLSKTIKGLNSIVKFALNKIYISTLQRWK